MKCNISKELFKEIMNMEYINKFWSKHYEQVEINGDDIIYEEEYTSRTYGGYGAISYRTDTFNRRISIGTFCFKCKEWAFEKGYDIYSDTHGADVCNVGSNYSIAPFHHSGSEQQACFDACQWILDNKDKQ